mgnify:CR=1 FL=1
MKVRRLAAIYFTFQGLMVFAWWAMLFLYPSCRTYFALEPTSETSLMALWLADISFLGVGSLAAGWLCFRGHHYAAIVSWFVTGAISYATVYCFAFALMTDRVRIGVALIFPAMVWDGVFA